MRDAEQATSTKPSLQWPEMTGQDLAGFLDVSAPWLRKLELQGFVEREENGLFNAGAVCLGYIRWLKDDARRHNKTEGAKRKDELQARKMELEIAEKLGELVEFDLVCECFAEIFTMLRNEMGGIPAGITRDMKLRAELEKRHDEAFERCRLGFEKLKDKLQPGCVAGGEAEPDEADA